MSQETELKLIFDPADRDWLANAALLIGCPATAHELDATYYDTAGQALRAAGYSLRVRREDGRRVQTIKATGDAAGCAAGLFVRPEWEHPVDSDTPVLDPVADPLHAVFDPALLDTLRPVFRTVLLREKRIVERDGASLEVAIDYGEVIAGNRCEAVCELELELLSGEARALFDSARALDAVAPLRLSVLSKSERGYRLADDKEGKPAKAEPVDLSSVADVGTMFVRIALSCIRQIRLNEDIFLRTGSPESVHQIRVGVRRLRTAFTLFQSILGDDPAHRRFTVVLRELAAAMGMLRDLDVLMTHLAPVDRERLATAREEEREKAAMTLGLAKTRHLMLDLIEWLELGPWRDRLHESKWMARPPIDFAAHVLRRCRHRLKRAGEHWSRLDDAGRHQVRKETKKLRYAVEFFASLFPEGQTDRRQAVFRDALEDVQDDLGALNDISVAPELLAQFGLAGGVPPFPKRKRHAMIEHCGRKLSALLDAKCFWV